MSALTFLDAGSFRHRFVLEEPLDLSDGMGGTNNTWFELRSIWAHFEPVRADMRERASQTDEIVTHRIYLRQIGNMRSDYRLRKGSRIFTIDHFHDPDETGRYWLVQAIEETL